MPFLQNQPYPQWNPSQINIVPDIPQWTKIIGSFTITFQIGSKFCYVNQKFNHQNIYSGDYTIHITSTNLNWTAHRYTDEALFTQLMLPNLQMMGPLLQNNFLMSIRQITNFNIEVDLVNYINTLGLNDELKVVLYTLWHRAIIEDRLYHPSRFSGYKQVLGVAIALIRKLQGMNFQASNDINYLPYLMPKNIYVRNCTYWFNNL